MGTKYPLTESLARDWPRPSKLLYASYPRSVRQARCLGLEFDDLDSMCWLGAMKAEESFDPARGVKFKSYAVTWMRSELTGWVRGRLAAKRAGVSFSMDAAAWADGPSVADLTAGPDVWAEYDRRQEVAEVLRVAEERLPASVRAVVYATFGVGNRVSEGKLCETLKLPHWVVSRMRKAGLEAIRAGVRLSE